jgi:transcriptional regulator with XRE-family HTH domain
MSYSTSEELQRLGIGKKIRTIREAKAISISDLAEKVDIPPVLLSQIENDVVPPTLATLLNLARVLAVGVDHFFVKEASFDKIELTRVNERLSVTKSRESDQARMTYNYQALAYRLKDKQMEPFLVEFDAETEEQPIPLSHEGEEFCYCLEGEIEFITDEQRILLRPGDAMYYYADVPHVLRGVGPGKPKGIFVLLPPRKPPGAGR